MRGPNPVSGSQLAARYVGLGGIKAASASLLQGCRRQPGRPFFSLARFLSRQSRISPLDMAPPLASSMTLRSIRILNPSRLALRTHRPGSFRPPPLHHTPARQRVSSAPSIRPTTKMAGRVHRVTMFKLPKSEDRNALMERYKKLDAENSKVIQQTSLVLAWPNVDSDKIPSIHRISWLIDRCACRMANRTY